ncbi:MAG: response regulator transcription factor [Filimonas sp.]|nr:response regulator transcription factor [Filimonas sp.]
MKVSIVEDNKTFAGVLEQVIQQAEGFDWCKTYYSAEEAIQNIYDQVPDVVVMDITLPGMNGIDLMRKLKPTLTNTLFMICSIHDEDDTIFAALQNGADGYILKDSSIDEIQQALGLLVKGGAPMSPYIARKVLGSFRKEKKSEPLAVLTSREQEILDFTATGLSAKEIADKLSLSPFTVQTHIRNIYTKLQVQNKVEALKKLNRL